MEGETDFLLFWRTLPCDHAPGALLLTEAGGAAIGPDGTTFRADDARTGLRAAPDDATSSALVRGLGLRGMIAAREAREPALA